MGDFSAIVRLGLRDVLDSVQGGDVATVEAPTAAILDQLEAAAADVVVLDLDGADGAELAERIASRHPSVTVIGCSASSPVMRVFPAHHGGESYTTNLSPTQLVQTVLQP